MTDIAFKDEEYFQEGTREFHTYTGAVFGATDHGQRLGPPFHRV